MNGLEMKILEGLLSALTVVVGTVVTTYGPRLKHWMDRHLNAKEATMADHVISGLGNISEAVVQQFNQSVVADAKANGNFNEAYAKKIKEAAVAAVKSQGANLVALGNDVLGNVDALIGSLIEKAVTEHYIPTAKPKEPEKPEPNAAQQAAADAQKELTDAQAKVKAAQEKVQAAQAKV